ncbi:MAG: type I glyceraldehyde-3-phosphate dehydrogenase [Bacteroidales bacterium]|jgi:glyceraldehyde 3-phosphate dehydrogenase|nr:type I glyceraldehyde-3-phosphate dehydrogenase [Bacteroidales bacterium]MCK9499345.1 type I glyceraldehyde-3-phosphate dehydrogenase [Bacteroidales bacterium]MDY0315760.1 glyceraldehyde 3-phosphate dehydrogenase NAD-binding domain-containing protein [Bacteroidales bacterium]NLB85528.1 type I glyceraldehyde-3-phosphate dehydrogenase [Bacteroidales bacterium]
MKKETIQLGVNGFGRIGKLVCRMLLSDKNFNLVQINDPMSAEMIAHLLKYDSLHGQFEAEIQHGENYISVNGEKIAVTNFTNPAQIPWNENKVNIVVDSSGKFKTASSLEGHLKMGAETVILSSPAGDSSVERSVVMGLNHKSISLDDKIISNSSCTTNCVAIVLEVLFRHFGVKTAFMNTVHPFTNNQNLQDGFHKDMRRARSAFNNIIPTTTSAIEATKLIYPELKNNFDGFATRVPVADCSFVELVAKLKTKVDVETINSAFLKESKGDLKKYLEYTKDPIVSSDVQRNRHSAIFDSQLTRVLDDDLIQIVAWYDNETGYSARIVDLIKYISDL